MYFDKKFRMVSLEEGPLGWWSGGRVVCVGFGCGWGIGGVCGATGGCWGAAGGRWGAVGSCLGLLGCCWKPGFLVVSWWSLVVSGGVSVVSGGVLVVSGGSVVATGDLPVAGFRVDRWTAGPRFLVFFSRVHMLFYNRSGCLINLSRVM